MAPLSIVHRDCHSSCVRGRGALPINCRRGSSLRAVQRREALDVGHADPLQATSCHLDLLRNDWRIPAKVNDLAERSERKTPEAESVLVNHGLEELQEACEG